MIEQIELAHPILTGFWVTVGCSLAGLIFTIPALIVVGILKYFS